MAYPDTAYTMNQLGLLVNMADYLTEDERNRYIASYLAEGDFNGTGEIKILPTAKATEILYLNKTDWDKFAAATGATLDTLTTMEGIAATAEDYYRWSGGRAFFGYDAMDNYCIIGAMQLGTELFSGEDGAIHFDKAAVRKLWDAFYLPFVQGFYTASGRFRSDDVKTGNAIAYIGSTSSATYFPTQVITSDTDSYPIEMLALPLPVFSGGTEARSILKYSLLEQATADREAVLAAIEDGASRSAALAPYLTSEAFEAWYYTTLQQLQACTAPDSE